MGLACTIVRVTFVAQVRRILCLIPGNYSSQPRRAHKSVSISWSPIHYHCGPTVVIVAFTPGSRYRQGAHSASTCRASLPRSVTHRIRLAMAGSTIEAGGALARAIQSAVQLKLMEKGWVIEENDSTLSEYVTNMIVDGKDLKNIQNEMGTELLGVGEDDPEVVEFAKWLGEQVQTLSTQQQQSMAVGSAAVANMSGSTGAEQVSAQSVVLDKILRWMTPLFPWKERKLFLLRVFPHRIPSHSLFRSVSMILTYLSPTGPKSMRNGGAGRGPRGGRILGQLNKHLDRSQELPDNLRRIKGAANGHGGRINAHSSRDGHARGPKGAGIAHGLQRMANGGARGGQHPMNPMNQMNPMNNPMMPGMPGMPGMLECLECHQEISKCSSCRC
ncbi:hypothetical protein MRB53_041329 [Persea americana]|nr:hypothetical protein MRB53_041329 [Persea americana]